jgi:hypothetical protein
MKKLLLLGAISITTLTFAQFPNNYSLELDGTDDLVVMASGVTNQPTLLSVSAYVYMNTLTHNNDPQANIVEQALNGQWSLGYDLPTKSYLFGVRHSGGWYKVYAPADSLVWQNVVGTFDKANGTIKIYLNGSLVDELNSIPVNDLATIASYPFSIGGRNAINKTIDGLIDDVHVWSLVMDSVQIQNFMDCPPVGNEAGIMGYWNFETGTGTTAIDQTTNTNDGTLTNGPTWSTNTPYYNCGLGIEELTQGDKELIKIVDLMGRETTPQMNKVLIYVYSDGTIERVFEFE